MKKQFLVTIFLVFSAGVVFGGQDDHELKKKSEQPEQLITCSGTKETLQEVPGLWPAYKAGIHFGQTKCWGKYCFFPTEKASQRLAEGCTTSCCYGCGACSACIGSSVCVGCCLLTLGVPHGVYASVRHPDAFKRGAVEACGWYGYSFGASDSNEKCFEECFCCVLPCFPKKKPEYSPPDKNEWADGCSAACGTLVSCGGVMAWNALCCCLVACCVKRAKECRSDAERDLAERRVSPRD